MQQKSVVHSFYSFIKRGKNNELKVEWQVKALKVNDIEYKQRYLTYWPTAILHKYLKSNQGRKSCKDIKNVLGGKGNLVKTSEANNEAG
jgi:hypothetical protein